MCPLYIEVVFSSKVQNVYIGKQIFGTLNCVFCREVYILCPYLGGSTIRGSTNYTLICLWSCHDTDSIVSMQVCVDVNAAKIYISYMIMNIISDLEIRLFNSYSI